MMYTVTKRIEVAGAHQLDLPYDSKCRNMHGHNWVIHVTCQSEKLDENGMVTDFTKIKDIVMQLDHAYVNNVLNPGGVPSYYSKPINPTAENIAKWICERVPNCIRVEVQESEGNVAVYDA